MRAYVQIRSPQGTTSELWAHGFRISRSPGSGSEEQAKGELDVVRAAMKAGEWVDLPWFSARAEVIEAVYLESSSVGFA